ncbi:protein of unknown function [Polaromonas sp. OV174]|uniref:DUF4148 domain-containing protein n=1 Tax=Polaromonas sp. OV174 TaxID=1855300 RepID=UPI0008EB1A6A|nr:DUF4148 domain-containing protein [Polaromonas sp. OV174]SFB87365.1 protein of unknown function [Polaromonas sp. OV174]
MNNRKILASTVIALASLAAGSAFADSYDQQHPVMAPTQSSVTRAQVQAELLQAQKSGTWSATDDYSNYPAVSNTGTPKTRAEVQAELRQAQKDGSIPAYRG